MFGFFLGKEQIKKALPIFDIILFAATGSEMNGYAVVTNEKTKQNLVFGHLWFIQKFLL